MTKIVIDSDYSVEVQTLLAKFGDMNIESLEEYNYFESSTIRIGFNTNSGYSYIYIEDDPSVSICLDISNTLYVVYRSNLDSIEFKRPLEVESMSKLESLIGKAYRLEDKIRADDYCNDVTTTEFIDKMEAEDWMRM